MNGSNTTDNSSPVWMSPALSRASLKVADVNDAAIREPIPSADSFDTELSVVMTTLSLVISINFLILPVVLDWFSSGGGKTSSK